MNHIAMHSINNVCLIQKNNRKPKQYPTFEMTKCVSPYKVFDEMKSLVSFEIRNFLHFFCLEDRSTSKETIKTSSSNGDK